MMKPSFIIKNIQLNEDWIFIMSIMLPFHISLHKKDKCTAVTYGLLINFSKSTDR